jgi:hypothetical protein
MNSIGKSPDSAQSAIAAKFHCLSFANQAATFFANSTCIFSSAFSARNRSNSARSESPHGLPTESPDSFAYFTQLPNVIACTPILRATTAIDR